MPFGSIPHDTQRPDYGQRHDDSYERAIIRATAAPFIVFPAAALLDQRMTHPQRQVLLSMCWHANKKHLVWCSQETIAAELHMPRQMVTKNINALIALGYLEIVRKAYRGSENAALRTNKYRVIWDASGEIDEIDDDPDSQFTHRHLTDASIGISQMHHRHLTDAQKSTIEEYHYSATSSSGSPEIVINQPSLAQSAETAPPTVTAPPERRTRESGFDSSALRRDPLYVALSAYLPEPVTYDECRTWAVMLSRLHRANVKAADIATAVSGYHQLYPTAVLTIRALVNHWAEIREGKSREQLQLAQRTRSSASRREAEADRQREIHELARIERERIEAEWEAEENLRSGAGTSGLLGGAKPQNG